MREIGYVVLGRYGDIINALPIAYDMHRKGFRVRWAVGEEFAGLFDGVSYVEPLVIDRAIHYGNVDHAEELLRAECADVKIPQVFGNRSLQRRNCQSFATEMWRRVGFEDRWHELPLVFDRRERSREFALRERLIPADGRPVISVALGSVTSPFREAPMLLKALRERFGDDVFFLDLTQVRAHRLYDLIGILERSACLISIDTSILHLSYACRVPTVGFLCHGPYRNRDDWYGTEPREHWIGWCRYSEVLDRAEEMFDRIDIQIRSLSREPVVEGRRGKRGRRKRFLEVQT